MYVLPLGGDIVVYFREVAEKLAFMIDFFLQIFSLQGLANIASGLVATGLHLLDGMIGTSWSIQFLHTGADLGSTVVHDLATVAAYFGDMALPMVLVGPLPGAILLAWFTAVFVRLVLWVYVKVWGAV